MDEIIFLYIFHSVYATSYIVILVTWYMVFTHQTLFLRLEKRRGHLETVCGHSLEFMNDFAMCKKDATVCFKIRGSEANITRKKIIL